MKYESPFDIGDKVHMDGMNDVSGTVTCISWRNENPQIEVSWWSERTHCAGWFSPWRLALA